MVFNADMIGSSYQRADPEARRRALTVLLTACLLLVPLWIITRLLLQDLDDLYRHDPESALAWLVLMIRGIGLITSSLLAGIALYLWRHSRRIIRAERFPLPGQAVIRPVRILEGSAAVRRGRMGLTLSLFFALCAIALIRLMWSVADHLNQGF